MRGKMGIMCVSLHVEAALIMAMCRNSVPFGRGKMSHKTSNQQMVVRSMLIPTLFSQWKHAQLYFKATKGSGYTDIRRLDSYTRDS